eukprot:TRINITY_DN5120_c0_g1_i4.p1 TRINITY_DN5120_c0_g1~~TRINITY_DN5120_c0_g1_i4.p1  ORF type:complete len:1215 (+),score=439.95 TRINITY_DN5120_c0_g1_i4:569-4213(+)
MMENDSYRGISIYSDSFVCIFLLKPFLPFENLQSLPSFPSIPFEFDTLGILLQSSSKVHFKVGDYVKTEIMEGLIVSNGGYFESIWLNPSKTIRIDPSKDKEEIPHYESLFNRMEERNSERIIGIVLEVKGTFGFIRSPVGESIYFNEKEVMGGSPLYNGYLVEYSYKSPPPNSTLVSGSAARIKVMCGILRSEDKVFEYLQERLKETLREMIIKIWGCNHTLVWLIREGGVTFWSKRNVQSLFQMFGREEILPQNNLMNSSLHFLYSFWRNSRLIKDPSLSTMISTWKSSGREENSTKYSIRGAGILIHNYRQLFPTDEFHFPAKIILEKSKKLGIQFEKDIQQSLNIPSPNRKGGAEWNVYEENSVESFAIENQMVEVIRNDDFLPSIRDIFDERCAMDRDVPVNVIEGSYTSFDEYKKTHYDLFREDCFHTLRKGLQELKKGNLDERDMRIFKGKMEGIYFHPAGQGTSRVFSIVPLNRLNGSKPFLYGNLLCFSQDSFNKNVLYGKVFRQAENLVWIQVYDESKWEIEYSGDWLIAENPTYFGAYEPVLRSLEGKLALSDFSEGLSSPVKMNSLLVKGERKGVENGLLVLGESQSAAMDLYHRKRMCLIQGPPGTGKTFIGLQIVSQMTQNSSLSKKEDSLEKKKENLKEKKKEVDKKEVNNNAETLTHSQTPKGPIVVITYKNHSLDQFLEGILRKWKTNRVVKKLMRIGGRSSSSILEDFTLSSKTREVNSIFWIPGKARSDVNQIINHLGSVLKSVRKPVFGLKKEMIPMELQRSFDERSISEWLPECGSLLKEEMITLQNVQQFQNLFRDNKNVEREGYEEDEKEEEEEKWGMEEDNAEDLNLNGDNFVPISLLPSSLGLGYSFVDVESSIWELSSENRRQLAINWILEHESKVKSETERYRLQIDRFNRFFEDLGDQNKLENLKGSDVIGLTSTGAALNRKVLERLKPRALIVEEAAEIIEAGLIAEVRSDLERIVLIGDHQQLPPPVCSHELELHHAFNVSMFERLVKNGIEHVTLTEQCRMLSSLSWMMKVEYPTLKDHPSTRLIPSVPNFSVLFWDHQNQENSSARSFANQIEVEGAVKAAFMFKDKMGIEAKKITVLTTYRGQLRELRRRFGREPNFEETIIQTVDNYQGDENDVIILSLVRSEALGFLKSSHRAIVALSRCKRAMLIMGNSRLLERSKDSPWAFVVKQLRDQNLIKQIPK